MKIALAMLAVVGVIAMGLVAYTLSDNPHDFSQEDCVACHLDPSDHPKAMRTSISRMCDRCHRKMTRRSSHPVDRAPELARIPEDLPLSNGKITCNTCHNVHEKRFAAFGSKTYLLRRPAIGREFCLACHETRRSQDTHMELLAVAHEGNKYTVVDDSNPLDPLSLDCIGCHDGSIGRVVSHRIGQGAWSHDSGAHPIGVGYRESRMRKGGLVPVSMLDKRLRLFGGKVGCGTCHDIYSKLPNMLAMSNAGSDLCLSCHRK